MFAYALIAPHFKKYIPFVSFHFVLFEELYSIFLFTLLFFTFSFFSLFSFLFISVWFWIILLLFGSGWILCTFARLSFIFTLNFRNHLFAIASFVLHTCFQLHESATMNVCALQCVDLIKNNKQTKSITDVFVSVGSKKELRSLEVRTSPKQRASIVAASSLSMDASIGNHEPAEYTVAGSGTGTGATAASISTHPIQHQLSLDQSCSTSKASSMQLSSTTSIPLTAELSECQDIVAESLEKILDNKLVREKRIEMEKKLETMRKKHDKEKLRATAQRSGDLTDGIRKSKFYMNNKLVKRLSNKNL